MKNVKKIAALGLSATMAMGMLPATLVSADEATGTVYYLNFKPEQADQWKKPGRHARKLGTRSTA